MRRATTDDAPAIARVYVDTWRITYAGSLPDKVLLEMSPDIQAARWARAIERGREIVDVAEDETLDVGGSVIGVGSGGPNRQRGSSFAGEVYTLYVATDHQNQGIGKRLLRRLFEDLSAAGYNSAVIWVLADNPSRFFYEAMNGVRLGERTEEIWGTTLREIGYGWPDLSATMADWREKP